MSGKEKNVVDIALTYFEKFNFDIILSLMKQCNSKTVREFETKRSIKQ